MKLIIAPLLCSVLFLPGCVPVMRPLHWLGGTWEMPKPNGSLMLETWEIKDENTMTGQGLKVMEGDTSELETISLYHDRKDVWYVPTVPDQNNSKPIPFKLVEVKDHQYIFENPAHDFPQRIQYEFKPVHRSAPLQASIGDTLFVAVTDLNNEGIHFRFTRQRLK